MPCPDDYQLIGEDDDDGKDHGVYVPIEHSSDRGQIYFCKCGCFKFEVFSPAPYYTSVRCTECECETVVHSG